MSFSLYETFYGTSRRVDSYSLTDRDRRVLIVDDEQEVLELFSESLSAKYICRTARSATEALKLLSKEEFALVISDVLMPGLSGIELLREIMTHYPGTAVLLISAVNLSDKALELVRSGPSDFLTKPCDLGLLSLYVERALERRIMNRTAEESKEQLDFCNFQITHLRGELERLQDKLLHCEKMVTLGRLTAGVAHELKNPASFIYGNVELLESYISSLQSLLAVYEQVPLTGEIEAKVSTIKKEIEYENSLKELRTIFEDCKEGASRIKEVVQNLRVFSDLAQPELKRIDINEGIDSTLRLITHYLAPSRIRVKRLYSPLPLVDTYGGQLNQVWMNLLINAAQAITGEGEITIQTLLQEDSVQISISDTGCGISLQNRSRIFEPFFTTKSVSDGTGLGLSISRNIIDAHGGRIEAESLPGVGSTFRVIIPVERDRQKMELATKVQYRT
jgi:two-component system, NtrC family, sensor kinase